MSDERPDEYVLPSTESESLRLERQGARLYGGTAYLTPYLSDSPGRVLDVGCGTGIFSRFLAEQLPESEVFGVDLDAGRLAFARQSSPPTNLSFQHGSLLELPFGDADFDLVHGRFVLVHATDPALALQEMARVTRPGGRIVAHEMIHDGIWFSPTKPAFARVLGEIIRIMRARGMEPSQGLHLAPGMIRAGLQSVQVQVMPHTCLGSEPLFEEYRKNWIDTFSGIGAMLEGELDAGEVEQALEELAETRAEDFLVELTVLASGVRRPT